MKLVRFSMPILGVLYITRMLDFQRKNIEVQFSLSSSLNT